MAKYIEALEKYDRWQLPLRNAIFMAGGITNCPDWQQEMRGLLASTEFTLLNPRRANFPMDDPNASQEQIVWEYKQLDAANEIMFWFPKETLCPIVLFELGKWLVSKKKIFVGMDPEYKRRQDVEIQTRLERPDLHIAYSLKELADTIKRGK